jgi:hypothetical protein
VAKPITPEQVPDLLIDVFAEGENKAISKGRDRYIADALAAALSRFDEVIRAEIVRWIEAQMHKCPHGHDRGTGHRALCNWCWHNAALIGAARLARGDHGSTTAYALHRMAEGEPTDG